MTKLEPGHWWEYALPGLQLSGYLLLVLFALFLGFGWLWEWVSRRRGLSPEVLMAVDVERERIRDWVEGKLFEYEGTVTGGVLEGALEYIDAGKWRE